MWKRGLKGPNFALNEDKFVLICLNHKTLSEKRALKDYRTHFAQVLL